MIDTVLRRWARDESGQDLIEYALLAVLIAILSVAVFPSIRVKMGTAFGNWGAQVHSIWIPCNPGQAPPCP